MKNNGNATELKNSIKLLEIEQANKANLLNEEYHRTFKIIKPANILKSTLNEVTSSPFFMNKVLNTAVGLVSGYISKKLIVGDSNNKIRRLLGTFFQLGVSSIFVKHPDAIKTAGQFIIQSLLRKKKHKKSKESM